MASLNFLLLFNIVFIIAFAIKQYKIKKVAPNSVVIFISFLLLQTICLLQLLFDRQYIFSLFFLINSVILAAVFYCQLVLKAANKIHHIPLEEIIAQLPGHVYWKDLDGVYIGSNTNNWKDFGLSSLEDYHGKTDYDIFAKEEADKVWLVDNEIMNTGQSKIIEEEAVFNGIRVRYLSHKVPLRDVNNKIIGILGVSIDIAEAKKEVENKLRMLESIIAVTPGNVYWLDKNNIYLGCNENEAKAVGLLSPKDIVGKRNNDIQGFVIAEVIDQNNLWVLSSGKAIEIEEPAIILEDGSEATFLSKKVPLFNLDDEIIGMVGISFNITERKQLEASLKIANEKSQALIKFAAQAAHDIRSPLAALNMLIKDGLGVLPEKERIMLRNASQQINDIANNLLIAQRQENEAKESVTLEANEARAELIWCLLDAIISEKRVQYSDRQIQFIFEVVEGARSAFVSVPAMVFRRVMSNLMNNAVEAIDGVGKVVINLVKQDNGIVVELIDTGCGIAEQHIEAILHGGISEGKKQGFGMGLSSSKLAIESWGGQLQIASKLQQGTSVHLLLPEARIAPWFMEKVHLLENSTLVIIDDDQSIHDLWLSRWEQELKPFCITLLHGYQPKDLEQLKLSGPVYYLIDYEFIGHTECGLDVIERFGLADSATLVTSHFDEEPIRHRCQILGIRIIPKSFAAYVSFEILPLQADMVLIDDQLILREAWQMQANFKGIKLISFESFIQARYWLRFANKQTPIYIDSDLGDGSKGEEFAKELYDQGFFNLYLCTGYPSKSFETLAWIKDVKGKEFPNG